MGNTVAEEEVEIQPLRAPDTGDDSVSAAIRRLLMPLASLKLTVALFAMAIFIVFAGTLAQVEQDIWEAIDGYFRTPIAWIDFQIFFPASFFPSQPQVSGGFYFPGGWLIGLFMVINLLAAHGLRFKVQASGRRLLGGGILILVGMLVTWLVVVSGSNADGVQHEPWISWATLWDMLKVSLGMLWLVSVYGWIKLARRADASRWLVWLAGAGPVLLGALVYGLLYYGESARLNDSGMRILWQLIKGTFAGLVLLAGCVLVFRKRAGIVLLHGGVLLMMFSELLVGTMAEEGQMLIREGETVNYVQDIREVELAIIERVDPKLDDVLAIPQSILLGRKPIEHASLPCRVELLKYVKNSAIRPLAATGENLADTGAGLVHAAVEVRAASGTDSGGGADMASAYVKFSNRDGTPLGSYLLSQHLNDQELKIGDKSYFVSLRFKQTPKPYSIQLIDVRKDDYLGTDTPRNYSSDIRLVDESRSVDRKVHIWMNNPLRYAGETMYQSNFNVDPQTGVEITGLQVVSNTGWMIPYVACMIVATGMLAQFLIVLLRFLKRRSAEETHELAQVVEPKKRAGNGRESSRPAPESWPILLARYLPVAVLLLFTVWLLSRARVPTVDPGEMNLYEFGKLPVVDGGRAKPLDTLARNTLRIISNRQTFRDASDERQPAIRWLLDVIARPEIAEQHRVFRIENMEVLATLGLERRRGLLYSIAELRPKAGEFNDEVRQARQLEPKQLSTYQRKLIELDRRVRTYTLLEAAFRPLDFPAMPTEEEFRKDMEATKARIMRIRERLEAAARLDEMMTSMHPPLAVPQAISDMKSRKRTWLPYSTAWTDAYRQSILGEEINPATMHLTQIFEAYAREDADLFNREVARYQATIAADPPITDPNTSDTLNITRTQFEAFFDHFEAPLLASAMYLTAFLFACVAWLGWTGPLNRASFWLIGLTFLLHTFVLISRMYISGRPPVTNLYSSAVFIGWGCCAFAIVLECIYRLGIGNVTAGVAGFSTLLIAHFLAADGDTFTVLQAVLDTQFWLATHVVCITLGYAATLMAGLLAVLYVLLGVCTPYLAPPLGRSLVRMIYGIVCFAIFFSFVGTVLGGLWADDSWGRFWGWDPKENGALIIVLWNALVLHARWDGMVRDRGLAALAIGGNIATGWSWFGVNELGVGLHSYGFTEGVLLALGLFIASQLAIIALALIHPRRWWSNRHDAVMEAAA